MLDSLPWMLQQQQFYHKLDHKLLEWAAQIHVERRTKSSSEGCSWWTSCFLLDSRLTLTRDLLNHAMQHG